MGIRFKDLATSTSTVAGDDYFAVDGLTNGTRKILANTFMLVSTSVQASQMPALTGDVTTTSGTVATTIANNAITLAKMAQMATASFLGRNTAGTGNVEVLSAATARTILGLATVATSASAADLSAGTLLAARMPALTGDVTTTVGTVATTIANNAVTLAKMATMATASFLGRNTAGTGNVEVLSAATARAILSVPTAVSQLTNDSGYVTSGSSPTFGSVTASSFNVSSSLRYKTNVSPFNFSHAESLILNLRPVVYDRKDGSLAGEIGFIAEEMNMVLPQFVKKNPDGTCEAIDYSRLTALLVAVVQNLLTKERR